MDKKLKILITLLISSLVLVGFGEGKVTLLHKSKVIDLGKAIEIARLGGDEGEKNDTTAIDNPDSLDSVNPEEAIISSSIKIIVSGKTISIDGHTVSDEANVEDYICRTFSLSTTYELIDNYAESHVYKRIIEVLKKLHIEIGLKYSVED